MHRGQLGVTVQGVTPTSRRASASTDVRGALVSSVSRTARRSEAGIKRGDVIVSIDGQPVTDSNALRNRIASTKPGLDGDASASCATGGEKTLRGEAAASCRRDEGGGREGEPARAAASASRSSR